MPFDWFLEVPPVTRAWTSAIALVSVLEQCNVVNEIQLLYNYKQVFIHHEVSTQSIKTFTMPIHLCFPFARELRVVPDALILASFVNDLLTIPVVAARNLLPLFRPPQHQPHGLRLLCRALQPHARAILLRPQIQRVSLEHPAPQRHDCGFSQFQTDIVPVFGSLSVKRASLYMGEKEPRHSDFVFGAVCLFSALFALGHDVFFGRREIVIIEKRVYWYSSGACLLLFGGYISELDEERVKAAGAAVAVVQAR